MYKEILFLKNDSVNLNTVRLTKINYKKLNELVD